MLKFLFDWFKQETTLVEAARSKGKKRVRPSSIILALLAIFYVLSPIDIIPEKVVTPSVFGILDDIAILLLVSFYVYKDIRGILNERISNINIFKETGNDTQNSVHLSEQPIRGINNSSTSTTSSTGSDDNKSADWVTDNITGVDILPVQNDTAHMSIDDLCAEALKRNAIGSTDEATGSDNICSTGTTATETSNDDYSEIGEIDPCLLGILGMLDKD